MFLPFSGKKNNTFHLVLNLYWVLKLYYFRECLVLLCTIAGTILEIYFGRQYHFVGISMPRQRRDKQLGFLGAL